MNPSISRLRLVVAIVLGAVAVALTLHVRNRGEDPDPAVRKVLDDQVAAWNRGDLDGFMRGYWKSDELTFISGGTERHGWDETYSRYQWRYNSSHDELALTNLVGQGLAPAGVPAAVPVHQLAALGLMRAGAFEAEMGTLTFSDLQVTPTGTNVALVRGRWGLTFRSRPAVGGLFTLLFRKESQGWCIVHDHTSG